MAVKCEFKLNFQAINTKLQLCFSYTSQWHLKQNLFGFRLVCWKFNEFSLVVFETKKFTLPNISNQNCADRCKGFQYQRIFPDISIHINSKFSLALNHPLFLIINLRKLSNPACLFTLPRTSFIHRKNIWWTKIIYVNIFLDETAGNHAGQNHDEA